MLKELNAVNETNTFLEGKLRKMTAENQNFLSIIMDLKEKQIDRVNDMNDLVEEIEVLNNKL